MFLTGTGFRVMSIGSQPHGTVRGKRELHNEPLIYRVYCNKWLIDAIGYQEMILYLLLKEPGNSLTDPDAKRVADSYNGSPSNPPTLVYTYTFDAGAGFNGIDIEFADGTPTDYINGSNIVLPITVLGNGYGITSVEFYVNGTLSSTDTTAPYSFTNTYVDGSYLIEAVATDACEQVTKAFYINVGNTTGTYSTQVVNGDDDVEEDESGEITFDSSDLEMVYDSFDSNGFQTVGIRFQKVNIPYGATITDAYIQFRSDESNSATADLLITAEDRGDAAPFTGKSNEVSDKDRVSGNVPWDPAAWTSSGQTGTAQRSPDLTNLLQQVVDRCDWTQGNATTFIIEGTGVSLMDTDAKRVADSFEGSSSGAATLVYTYSYNTALNNSNITEYTTSGWNNGVPNSDSGVIIKSDYNTVVDGNIEACNLTIDAGRTLTVPGGSYINVAGDIQVDGTLVIMHEGSVVQTENDALVTNKGNIRVELTTPFLKPRDFMIMGSPMTNESRNGVFNAAFIVLNHTTRNFFPHPDVTAQFPGAENFADDTSQNGKFWDFYHEEIVPGRGYLVRPQASYTDGNSTYDMTYEQGTLNNGDVVFNVLYNTSKNDSPNVLANPYPSAIFADDFINANSMIDELYFWEHITSPNVDLPGSGSINFSMEDISMYNLTGGTPASSDFEGSTEPKRVYSHRSRIWN